MIKSFYNFIFLKKKSDEYTLCMFIRYSDIEEDYNENFDILQQNLLNLHAFCVQTFLPHVYEKKLQKKNVWIGFKEKNGVKSLFLRTIFEISNLTVDKEI